MKRIILSTLALCLGLATASAQNITPRVEVGANFSKLDAKGNDTKMRVGYRIGAAAEIDLGSGLYFAPGLTLRSNPTKFKAVPFVDEELGIEGIGPDIKHNAVYLSVPVNAGYRIGLSETLAVSLEAGPYFAYGIGGTTKFGDEKFKTFTKDSENHYYKRFDMGLGISAALECNNYSFRLGTEFGLTNIGTHGNKTKNQDFYLSVGYRF